MNCNYRGYYCTWQSSFDRRAIQDGEPELEREIKQYAISIYRELESWVMYMSQANMHPELTADNGTE